MSQQLAIPTARVFEPLNSHDPAELSRFVISCDPCSCSKRVLADRRVGVVAYVCGDKPGCVMQLAVTDRVACPGHGHDDRVGFQDDEHAQVVAVQFHTKAVQAARAPHVAWKTRRPGLTSPELHLWGDIRGLATSEINPMPVRSKP